MKTALVTGISGKIGGEIAKKLINDGYFVVGQYNSNEKAVALFEDYLIKNNLTDYFVGVKADFSKTSEIDKLYDRFKQNFSHIDLLVNNAGVDLISLVEDTTEQQFDNVFNINVKSAFMLTKKFIPDMLDRKSGNVIFISSIWGLKGASCESVYSASKFALVGLAKSLAKELGPNGIRVNAVCPGVIDSPMNDVFSQNEKQQLIDETPLKRLGKAGEVADLVSYLASDSSSFITGQAIAVDGGFTL